MHIMYAKKASGIYATAANSKRINGKVVKTDRVYLGKVIDKERGIYENADLGLVMFDLESCSFRKPDLAIVPPKTTRGKRVCTVDFGDAYVLDQYIRSMGLMDVLDNFGCPNTDTLKALLMFYILSDKPSSYAEDWYLGSYASILYPKANLDSRRISEFLLSIGKSESVRSFFERYIPFLLSSGASLSFIIDSTGIPNAIHMPETAINNHNGRVSMEVRLILVCRKEDRMPLYFRYVPGNVVDTVTLKRTVEELKCMGVQTAYVLIDAGYCTMENIRSLIDAHIGFITRVRPNYDLCKKMVSDHLADLNDLGTRVLHKDRFIRVTSEKITFPGTTRKVWLHLALDEDMKNVQDKQTFKKWQLGKLTEEQRDDAYTTNGLFVLVSSDYIAKEDVVDRYYERGGIEQLIDVGKSDCRLAEGGVEDITRLTGKWLVEFTAMAVNQSMQNMFKTRKEKIAAKKRKNKDSFPGRNMCPSHALFALRNQKCDVFTEAILPRERIPDVNTAYNLFDIEKVSRIDRTQ